MALLWELFPRHPNLLPASHRRADVPGPAIAKPRFGREGEGVRFVDEAEPVSAQTAEVYQARRQLPCFEGRYPVIGSWVIGDKPAGIGIREDATPITRNSSRFVPHWFE